MNVRFASEGGRRGPKWPAAIAILLTALIGSAAAGIETSSFTLSANTNHGTMVWGSSNTVTPTAPGTSGYVLTSNGASADPTYQALPSGSPHALLDGSVNNDTVAHAPVRGDVIVGNSTPAWARVATGTNGQFVGTDGTDTAFHTLAGTSNQITVTPSGTTTTLSTPQDIGTSSAVTFGTVQAKLLTSAKTADYGVLASDTGKVFRTTGASGTVIFTLPTSADGLVFGFYVDSANTLEILAPASTTIQSGGSVTTSAGNLTSATVGHFIWVLALGSNKYVCFGGMGTWTTA